MNQKSLRFLPILLIIVLLVLSPAAYAAVDSGATAEYVYNQVK